MNTTLIHPGAEAKTFDKMKEKEREKDVAI